MFSYGSNGLLSQGEHPEVSQGLRDGELYKCKYLLPDAALMNRLSGVLPRTHNSPRTCGQGMLSFCRQYELCVMTNPCIFLWRTTLFGALMIKVHGLISEKGHTGRPDKIKKHWTKASPAKTYRENPGSSLSSYKHYLISIRNRLAIRPRGAITKLMSVLFFKNQAQTLI